MPTDYYRKVYQPKLNYYGSNLKSKAVDRGIKEFERYLTVTPTRQEVVRDEEKIYVAIQKTQQTLVGDRYEKEILGRIEDGWQVGDTFTWENETWIIITQDKLTIPSHFKGKIRLCTYVLKWNENNVIYTTPGHVITSRAFAIDSGQKEGLTWEEGAMIVQAIVPSNDETGTIKRYHRFIIKDKAWRVVSIDNLSVDTLIFIRLEEDQINLATDDLTNGIADKYIPEEETEETIEGYVYTIDGSNKLSSSQIGEYTATIDGENASNVIFSIDDTTLADFTVATTTNPTSIKANTQSLVGNVVLSCHFVNTDKTISKTIQITSLWG
jgi:hypothetical protein